MDPRTHTALSRLAMRVRALLFVGGVFQGLAATAVAGACVLLAMRVIARLAPTPQLWWLWLLAPSVAYGFIRAWRQGPDATACAVHLDRKLGLGGLLLSGLERDLGRWHNAVADQTRNATVAYPNLALRHHMVRLLPAVTLFAVVTLLPPPAAALVPGERQAKQAALEQVQNELDRLKLEAKLDRQSEQDLSKRLEDLQDAMSTSTPPTWRDIDELQASLANELATQNDVAKQLAAALAAAMGEMAQQGATAGTSPKLGAAGDLLKQALAQAAVTGLLRDLPPELAAALAKSGLDAAAGNLDPKTLAGLSPDVLDKLTPEQLAKLAQALQDQLARGALGQDLAELLANNPMGAELAELLASMGEAQLCSECQGGAP